MNIEPGTGIDSVKYGIDEQELIQLFGKPDKIDIEDEFRNLWYSPRNLYFTFKKRDNFRLGTITVMGSGYSLLGKELFGLPQNTVKRFLAKSTREIPKKLDDLTGYGDESMEHVGLSILFWFDSSDNLSEMQCGYKFETDNNSIIWP